MLLHAFVMLALKLFTVLNAFLCITEGTVLQFAHQFGVDGDLFGSDRVQISHTVHVAPRGCHVQWRVVVIVQAPHIGTKRHQKGQTVEMAISCCQVKRSVSPNITFIWISSMDQQNNSRSVTSNSMVYIVTWSKLWVDGYGFVSD